MKISLLTDRLKALLSSSLPFAVLSTVLYLKGHWLFGTFAFIAIVNAVLAIIHPVLIKPVTFVLESLIKLIRIIFTAVFIFIMQCIIFAFIHLIGALFRKRFMGNKPDAESYYTEGDDTWVGNLNEPY